MEPTTKKILAYGMFAVVMALVYMVSGFAVDFIFRLLAFIQYRLSYHRLALRKVQGKEAPEGWKCFGSCS